MRAAWLWDRRRQQVVAAEVAPQVSAPELTEIGIAWQRFRRKAHRPRRASELAADPAKPEHNHWDWGRKAEYLRYAAYRCVGVRHAGDMQGLMLISLVGTAGRSKSHAGKPVLYVHYLESAPWNLKQYVGDEAQFGGVGFCLILEAIAISQEEGFRGRVGLHSLPQAEGFYSEFMEDLGRDRKVENLRYFELSQAAAESLMKGRLK